MKTGFYCDLNGNIYLYESIHASYAIKFHSGDTHCLITNETDAQIWVFTGQRCEFDILLSSFIYLGRY